MNSSTKQRQQTLDLYRRAIQSFGDRHPRPLVNQAYAFAYSSESLRSPVTWTEETRSLRVVLTDKLQNKATVEIRFPKPKGGAVKLTGTCSCSPGLESVTCRHTLMATSRLRALLINPMTPEIELILRGCDPSPVDSLVSTMDDILQREITRKAAEIKVDIDEDEKPTRVAFRLQWPALQNGRGPEVQVHEQTTLKSGNWSKGKLLSWPLVRERQGLFRSPHEKAVLKVAADSLGWNDANPYSSYSYYRALAEGPKSWNLLMALVGASNVAFARDHEQPIEVTTGEIGFGVDLNETGLRLAVLVGDEPIPPTARFLNDRSHGVIFATDHQLWLVPLADQAICELAEELHESRLEVPRADAAPIVNRLAKLGEFTRVQLPAEFQLGEVEADRRTYIELIPGPAAGLFVRVRVRPEPDDEAPLAFPGDQKLSQYLVSKEGYRKLIRDPHTEHRQATSIAAELQLDRFHQVTDWDWRIATDDETLEFLGQLKDRQDERSQRAVAALAAHEVARTSEGLPASPSDQPEALVLANETTALVPANEATPHALGAGLPTPSSSDNLGGLADNSESDDLVVLWPKGAKMRVTSEITPSALRIEIEDHNDWFGIQGTIEVDGHQIPLLDLLSAMKAGRKYIALGGGLWARISQEFQKRLRGLQDVSHQSHGKLEVDFTAAPVLNDLFDAQINLKACQAWRDVLKRMDDARDITPDPPISMTADLRDYQVEGFRWLKRLSTWGAGACLADDMGLGKTVQALALLIERMEEGPTLVVAPTSVGFNWMRETARFAPSINALAYRDSNRDELLQSVGGGDLVVVSYGLLQRDFEKFEQIEWGTLVLDEAQAVKNATTKTARAVRDLKAKWRIALTGTPIENHIGELWSLFRVINPGLFGSWERFRDKFGTPIEKHKDPERRAALSRLVRPFILRRTKDEVLKELPPRTEIEIDVELSEPERKRYEDARLKILAQLAGLDDDAGKDQRFQVLAGLMKLRQLACHPALQDKRWKKSSAKLDALLELVDELREEQHRALVFSQFTTHLDLVRKALDERGITYQYLDGSTPPKQRQQAVDAFQNGEGDLFLISLKAGGTGLNLTAADYVIHLDPWWNPAVEDQATDRAHRIGQTRPVTVYRLVTKETIEEKILAMHERKRELVAGILEGSDQAAKLSTDDLIDLIRGGAAPVTPARRAKLKASV
ncbi:MAG: DEAD/DEAH box helicase [Planctomycetaceae bacterium]